MGSLAADAMPGSPEVSFIVTGFGPFQNAKENPTMLLAHKLVRYLKAKEEAEQSVGSHRVVPLSSMTETIVIETAADAVQREIDALSDRISKQEHKLVVLLHLGVNYRGTHFQVESCAYNEANFRIPDQRGFQPRNKAILEDYPVGTSLQTLLDIPALVTFLNATGNGGAEEDEEETHKNLRPAKNNTTSFVLAKSSIDPGRFVCNYIYCYSLDKFQCSHLAATAVSAVSAASATDTDTSTAATKESNVRCLFLHVPPFAVVSEEEQLRVVSNLMQALYQQVRSKVEI